MKLIGFLLAALMLLAPVTATANQFAVGTQKCLRDLRGEKFSCVMPTRSDGPTMLSEYLATAGRQMSFEEARRVNGWPAHFRPETIVPTRYVGRVWIIFSVKQPASSR